MTRALITAVVCAILAGCAAPDQRPADSMLHTATAPSFLAPIDLFPKALGPLSWPITTTSAQAQAYFNQGLQLRYGFGVDEAARSFREAQRADPGCAMCYWGEAYALGSYLNGPITMAKAPHAFAASERAVTLAAQNASPLERDLIEATRVRYVANYEPEMKPQLDQTFADAMAAVHERYPDDLNITAIYASALFLLEPRRGTRDLDDPGVIQLHRVLEAGLAKDIRHPGLCHLYVHATESTLRPDLAEPCAEYLGTSIPGASHINHMPSHTWNEVGRWGDSVRANIMAWHSDLKAATGEGVPIYPSHNLHMLLFAASMDGQGAIAIQAGKDYTKLEGTTIYHALTLVRFGRFDEIRAVRARPTDDVGGGFWDFAQGYARLRSGDIGAAARMSRRILTTANSTQETFRRHPGRLLLGTVGQILEGEIERSRGDLAAAISSFEQAVEFEDSLEYDEPEPLPFAARHWLGAALLEAGEYVQAERVYREELLDHPHNVWSLHGLTAAVAAQGRQDPVVAADYAASTARTDTWITASRF